MSTPLSHRELLEQAAPLLQAGLRIDLEQSDRGERHIAFTTVRASVDCRAEVMSDDEDGQAEPVSREQTSTVMELRVAHRLDLSSSARCVLTRASTDSRGLIALLMLEAVTVQQLVDALEHCPVAEQWIHRPGFGISISRQAPVSASGPPRLQTTEVSIRVGGLDIRIDGSTGARMPADVLILPVGREPDRPRTQLANGSPQPRVCRVVQQLGSIAADARRAQAISGGDFRRLQPAIDEHSLPADVLAVLGPHWRPLLWQGGYWKSTLRKLGHGTERDRQLQQHAKRAAAHLLRCMQQAPEAYHPRHRVARWRAWLRRLAPAAFLLAILGLAPAIALWLHTTDTTLHPLAMGLAPLLMVGVIALTAREIPILELPSPPGNLDSTAFRLSTEVPLNSEQQHSTTG